MMILRIKLKGTYRIRNIDDVVVKGKTEPIGVYEVLDFHDDRTFPNLMDVVNHHLMKEEKNTKMVILTMQLIPKECIKGNENDQLSKTYIDRCNQLLKENPKDWDGVWVMKSK